MYNSYIKGLGVYVPEKILTNADLEKMVDTSDEWITTRTGIKTRHIVAPDEATSDLATKAALKACKSANISCEDIDLIIVSTASPDMLFPATAAIVQHNIGAKKAGTFDLEAGCSGFVYAMAVADGFIKTGRYKNVLVIGAETLTKITNFKDRNTCVLFGDGAGAVILQPMEDNEKGLLAYELGAKGEGGKFLKLEAGGSRFPASYHTVANDMHYIYMAGREVFKFAVRIIDYSLKLVIKKANLKIEDIDYFVLHQANTRIIESAAKSLKVDISKFVVNIDKYGNTSSASIPLALNEAIEDGRIKEGSIIASSAFGAGLTWASMVYKF